MFTVLVSGLASGALFAAAGLVYNLTFSTSKVLGVTTGQNAMLGGVFGAWFMGTIHLPAPVALLGSMAVGAAFGFITDLVAVRRVLNRSDEHLWLLSTLALATMTQQAVALWWGTEPLPFPRLIRQDFSAGLTDQKYWLPIVAVLLMAGGIELFYRRTLYGKLFVAMSEDAFAARARGIPTDRIRALSYVISGAMGGLAGFAAGQLTFAYFALGITLSLNGFIALSVGGLGSNVGALVGGAALGILTATANTLIGGEYQNTVAVGLLMVALLIKPAGLFGAQTARPV
jgi:branched-chain amino acid transport system permease protein